MAGRIKVSLPTKVPTTNNNRKVICFWFSFIDKSIYKQKCGKYIYIISPIESNTELTLVV